MPTTIRPASPNLPVSSLPEKESNEYANMMLKTWRSLSKSKEYRQEMVQTAAQLLVRLREILQTLKSQEDTLTTFSVKWSTFYQYNDQDKSLGNSQKILQSMRTYIVMAISEAMVLERAYTNFLKGALSTKDFEALLSREENKIRKSLPQRPPLVPNNRNKKTDLLDEIGNFLGGAGKTIEDAWNTIFDPPPPSGRPMNNSVFSRALYPVTCARCMKHISD